MMIYSLYRLLICWAPLGPDWLTTALACHFLLSVLVALLVLTACRPGGTEGGGLFSARGSRA